MTDKKISQLANAAALTGNELIELVQGGANVQSTSAAVAQLAVPSSFALVTLLLHMDGANGSSAFTDSSSYANTITAVGGVAQSTSNPKFGTACGNFAAASSELDVALAPNGPMDIWGGDCTVEGWINFAGISAGNPQHLFDFTNGGSTGVICFIDGSGKFGMSLQGFGGGSLSNPVIVPTNAWAHFAYVRHAGAFGVFCNGVPLWNAAYLGSPGGTIGGNVRIGNSFQNFRYSGLMDEVRLSLVARYVNRFTPPAAPFPNS